ncbi:hypothetical protein EON73_03120 [bacterium]|nr:MAG: hypothetical protein EON73_03120 [bacterium]
MSLLNNPIKPDYGEWDKDQLALELMNKILIAAPPNTEFLITDLIPKIESTDYTSNIIQDLHYKISDLLIKTFNYADHPLGRYFIRLTDKGRLVKSQGGHFEHIKKIADKDKLEKERQELNDEKLRLDIRNSQRVYKTYWFTFTFALISFIYIVIQIVLKIVE